MRNRKFILNYHLMLLPGIILLTIFSAIPVVGIVIAFQRFVPGKQIWDQQWVGLANFEFMMLIPDVKQVFINTVAIAVMKIIAGTVFPVLFALLINEVRINWFNRIVQTIVYLPHFFSWVVLAGIFITLLSLNGMINNILAFFGIEPIMFMASNAWFRFIVVATDTWKEFGFAAIVYIAVLTGINPALYEAAEIDGAGRLQQLLHITLPALMPTIILLLTLNLGNILNAGFEQIFNMYNPLVYKSGDIIDTYVYRLGILQAKYALATATGLLKSVVAIILIITSYKLAAKYANYRIF